MNFKSLALPLALALAAAGCASGGGKDMLAADAPRALPESGPVSVRWNDPATFTELRYSRNRWESERGPWLTDLAEYLRKRAQAQLPSGERLELTIVDVDRAGELATGQRRRRRAIHPASRTASAPAATMRAPTAAPATPPTRPGEAPKSAACMRRPGSSVNSPATTMPPKYMPAT